MRGPEERAAQARLDAMVTWLRGVLNETESREHGRRRLTRSVHGVPCPVPDVYGRCGVAINDVWWMQGEDQWMVEPCGHFLPQAQAFELLGAEPAADPSVLARVEAERQLLLVSTVGADPITGHAYEPEGIEVLRYTLRCVAYGHRHDAPGYEPEWTPDGMGGDDDAGT